MKKVINLILVLIVACFLIYTQMPTVNYGFTGFAVLLMILIGVWVLLNNPFSVVQGKNNAPTIKLGKPGKASFVLLIVLGLYITVVPAITSWALLRNGEYRNLIGKVETESNISSHMLPISIEKIRVVDQSLAQLLGDKVLGSQSALGSQVTLGTFHIQKVNNDLYWVAPLLHSGFFKWNKNMQGTNEIGRAHV